MQRLREHLKFLANFALRPHKTGSIVPSSRALALKMLSSMDFSQKQNVIEIGPGTGAVTKVILESLPDRSRYMGIELNKDFVKELVKKFPGVEFHQDSAENLTRYLKSNGESPQYHVIASLPWSLLGTTLQKKMLRTISGIMSPDTKFVTYGYIQARILPSGIKFERLLHRFFKKVKISKLVWRNVPPAVVYYCEGPKPPQE